MQTHRALNHEERLKRFNASEMPAIMHEYIKTPSIVLREKITERVAHYSSPHISFGLEHEEEALKDLSERMQLDIVPGYSRLRVANHLVFSATPDAITKDGKILVEQKCPKTLDDQMYRKYYSQIQTQLMCFPEAEFVVFNQYWKKDDLVKQHAVLVYRNDIHIFLMVAKALVNFHKIVVGKKMMRLYVRLLVKAMKTKDDQWLKMAGVVRKELLLKRIMGFKRMKNLSLFPFKADIFQNYMIRGIKRKRLE